MFLVIKACNLFKIMRIIISLLARGRRSPWSNHVKTFVCFSLSLLLYLYACLSLSRFFHWVYFKTINCIYTCLCVDFCGLCAACGYIYCLLYTGWISTNWYQSLGWWKSRDWRLEIWGFCVACCCWLLVVELEVPLVEARLIVVYPSKLDHVY